MKNLADISPAQLRRAADIREQVDALAKELLQIFGLGATSGNPRGWSEARHAKFDRTIAERNKPNPPRFINRTYVAGSGTTPRRKMSAAARAKIAAAARRRWAKVKAAGRHSL